MTVPPTIANPQVSATRALAKAAVTRIKLRDFRNYPRLDLTVGDGPVVLTGSNGAGKTNLIEAISMLAPGTGLRRAKLDEMDRIGGGPWQIEAEISSPDGVLEIKTKRDALKDRRLIAVNDKNLGSSGGLADLMAILWLTPALDRLFVEAGSSRRRFLDRLVLAVTSSHATQVRAFEKAMRERLKLLRGHKPDPAWLSLLERQMAEAAVAVAAARLDLIQHLQAMIDLKLDPFDRPKLMVKGEVETWLGELPALDVEERICKRLAADRARDAEYGATALGTHRSDLTVFDYATMEPAANCSTGRQKALLIAIILAEARLRARLRGALPILLLDEITAHLDAQKRAALMASLDAIGAQAWLTGTEPGLFADLTPKRHYVTVDDGQISPNRIGVQSPS